MLSISHCLLFPIFFSLLSVLSSPSQSNSSCLDSVLSSYSSSSLLLIIFFDLTLLILILLTFCILLLFYYLHNYFSRASLYFSYILHKVHVSAPYNGHSLDSVSSWHINNYHWLNLIIKKNIAFLGRPCPKYNNTIKICVVSDRAHT